MKKIFMPVLLLICTIGMSQNELKINEKDYFEMDGLNVIAFIDFYPEGHQSGVTIIQHGDRFLTMTIRGARNTAPTDFRYSNQLAIRMT